MQEIKTNKSRLPDFALLSKIKTWHVDQAHLNKQKSEIEMEIGKLQTEEKSLKDAIQKRLGEPDFADLDEKGDLLQAIRFLQQKIETIKIEIKTLDKDADHLRVKAQLEKYAKNLEDEKPCPLCGSTHHPEIYSPENIRDEQNLIEKKRLDFETEIETHHNTIFQLKDWGLKLEYYAKLSNDWKIKSADNKIKTETHKSLFQWPDFVNHKTVEDAFESAEILQQSIKKKEEELEKITTQFEKETKNKERFQEEIDKIKTALTVHQTETTTIQQQLKMVLAEEFSDKQTIEIEGERASLLQKYTGLEKQFNDLTGQLTKLQETKNNLAGGLNANKLELVLEEKTLSGLQDQLQNQLGKTGYANIDEVKKILSQSIDLEKQKQSLAAFNQALALAKARFADLEKEMGKQIYDAAEHKKILEEIKTSSAEITSRKEKLGEIKTLLKKLQDDIKTQAALRESFDKLELRAENIKTLKSLFKASGFVNYISSVYLQNLCNAANERFFKLTRQKLSLEITEDNNFQVRDFLNGGKVRNVKTLSGGQTFQAALSLALALADNIQKITESNQNFFFLDEGFGSLDKESLSIVFDTLKSLRKENRIVGVISHVEEMQQEIDVHLRIENNDETGSMIVESWAV
jgi:exonuclease SbcC